tara:strand:- start:9925 stop:11148 length:1224 start_codon:yes stop_codon:yes gene_type:complete
MPYNNNLNFKRFISSKDFKIKNSLDKKNFNISIKTAKENINLKRNVFHSFNKKFKLNFKLSELKKYKKFKRIIIIGMGGSILGAQAINYFLPKKSNKDIIYINNLDFNLINKINRLKNLKNSLFVIISKSGNTIEVLSTIKSLNNNARFNKKNSIVITDNKKSFLSSFAKKKEIKIIFHRYYIGGRYSVFSETALVPIYLMGIDIFKLKKNISNYLKKNQSLLMKNLINLTKIYKSKKINSLILLNYCPGLKYFLLWCQQLIAESLGKKGKGIIPIVSIAPRDHHSLLQLYLDGPKDKFFYIFSIKQNKKIKRTKGLFAEAINNSNIYNVLETQKNAMISILKNKKIPFISVDIKKRNEETLGELFSYFIIETVFLAESLGINPYNQPAVEQIKTLTKQNLFTKNQK